MRRSISSSDCSPRTRVASQASTRAFDQVSAQPSILLHDRRRLAQRAVERGAATGVPHGRQRGIRCAAGRLAASRAHTRAPRPLPPPRAWRPRRDRASAAGASRWRWPGGQRPSTDADPPAARTAHAPAPDRSRSGRSSVPPLHSPHARRARAFHAAPPRPPAQSCIDPSAHPRVRRAGPRAPCTRASPIAAPVMVCTAADAALSATETAGSSTSREGRASPKSSTFTCPSAAIITLCGLKSRCTSPAACAAASPRPAARQTPSTSSSDRAGSLHPAIDGHALDQLHRDVDAIAKPSDLEQRAPRWGATRARARELRG